MSIETSSDTRTVSVVLPKELAEKAEQCGLLAPAELERLLEAEIRRQAWAKWHELRNRMDLVEETDELMDEVVALVKEVRHERASENRP